MTLNWPIGIIGSVAPGLLAATRYNENHDRNLKLWPIQYWEIYACADAAGMLIATGLGPFLINQLLSSLGILSFLTHLTQPVKWAIAIT